MPQSVRRVYHLGKSVATLFADTLIGTCRWALKSEIMSCYYRLTGFVENEYDKDRRR